MNHIEQATARVRLAYDALQERSPGEKLYVAYSGGKDSEVIVQICREAVGGASCEVHYHATGIDPPELVRHVKRQFRAWVAVGIECHFDRPTSTMHDLIVQNGPPTRLNRFCCRALKENGGEGRVVITGVRWAESDNRSKRSGVAVDGGKWQIYNNDNDIRRLVIENCSLKSRITVNPIVDWSHRQVWAFIRERGLLYCCLYTVGFLRLGCIGCPNAAKGRYKQFTRWPHMERYYRRAFADFLKAKPESCSRNGWLTVDDLWHWWMEDGFVKGQVGMDEYLEGLE